MDYNVFFPIFNGQLNLNEKIGGSMSAVLADLEAIWTHCLNKLLNIKSSEFHVSQLFYGQFLLFFKCSKCNKFKS